MVESAFPKYEKKAWPFEYRGTMRVGCIAGGTPSDPKTIEGWINKNIGEQTEAAIRRQVVEVMTERKISSEEAVEAVSKLRSLNGFKRARCPRCLPAPSPLCDAADVHTLYIEGRHLKAAIKEAVSVAAATKKLRQQGWGTSGKWVHGFVAEHVQVVEDILPLGVTRPTDINQRFGANRHGAHIQYEEFCTDVDIDFTITTDHKFTDEEWAMIWLTGGLQGIGAARSQGYGRYTVTKWELVREPKTT